QTADLSGANLSEANLQYADLNSANLYESNLSGADLHGADVRGVIYIGESPLGQAKWTHQAHLPLLLQGVEAWNQWRSEQRTLRPDLVKASLENKDLRGV